MALADISHCWENLPTVGILSGKLGLDDGLLFVYGTLRAGFDGPMARWLYSAARWMGPATAGGRLYHVADYPAFVPGGEGWVEGDLFLLADPIASLPVLDDYEECSARYPEPQEYARQRIKVRTEGGEVEAWTYAYAWPVEDMEIIASGDFLA